MAHPEGVNHLTSPKDMDVIDVDIDTVHIKQYTPLKESDIAKLILKRDIVLKAVESSDSENDSDTVIYPKKTPAPPMPLFRWLDTRSIGDSC